MPKRARGMGDNPMRIQWGKWGAKKWDMKGVICTVRPLIRDPAFRRVLWVMVMGDRSGAGD